MERWFSGVFFIVFCWHVSCQDAIDDENYTSPNQTSDKAYLAGVDLGIINPEKYSFESFLRDEQNVFKDSYRRYVAMNGTEPINYEEWLVMNHFGILADTQESLFAREITKRSTADNKKRFLNIVRKGDILISGWGVGELVGHAAIMTTDTWVLEMVGGAGWHAGIEDNNMLFRKDEWFDIYVSHWKTVYRCQDRDVADAAAVWAYHNYYNPTGGRTKTIHVTYKITSDLRSTNPSYCSKLVAQAYYFGTENKPVIQNFFNLGIIVPSTIPFIFNSSYKLINKGRY